MKTATPSSKGRIALTTAGAIVLVLGALVIAAGGAALWQTGKSDSGYISSGVHRFDTTSHAIVTEDWTRAQRFLKEVDSSSIMVNTSTHFANGYEYGLGAEIGISTNKLHARGPVGLEGLTSQKWIMLGDGHVRT